MKVVYKYTLYRAGVSNVKMNEFAEILKVHAQDDDICIWALCEDGNSDDNSPDFKVTEKYRKFEVYPTGFQMNYIDTSKEKRVHLDTVFFSNNQFVYHVFELIKLR